MFPAKTLINLTALAQQTGPGIARDINNSGDVVGSQDFGAWNGFIWRPSLYSAAPGTWTTRLQPGDFESVEANAINDASPPTVVGTVIDPVLCPQPPIFFSGALAFAYVIGDSDVTMDGDNVLTRAPAASEALDINTAGTVRVGGGTVTCDPLGDPPCQAENNAFMWSLSPEDSMVLADSGVDYGSRVNAVNSAAMAAGWGRVGNAACRQQAHWWSSPTATPVNLHVVGWDPDEQSEALGMNDAAVDGSVLVAGTSISQTRAALWRRDSLGSWTLEELTCEISPLCEWILIQAYDVNDSGWIVGVGFVDNIPSKQRAFLLRPIELAGDVNYDCLVDGADLGLLLAGWGSDPTNCNFDLNLDGTVDGADLGLLLVDWDETCTPPCESTEAMAAGGFGDSDSETALLAALSSLGFDSVADFNAWSASVAAEKSAAILNQLAAMLSK